MPDSDQPDSRKELTVGQWIRMSRQLCYEYRCTWSVLHLSLMTDEEREAVDLECKAKVDEFMHSNYRVGFGLTTK